MDWIPESTTVDNLPDEVLAAILKLVADMPVPAWNRAAPFPIAAGRVDRRWRALVLGYPEFWTNIRIAHRSRSWIWAALFVKRSQSCLLDISINLQSYMYQPNSACVYKTVQPRGRAYIPMAKALAILGPHVGRWRTIVLRAWENQLCEFFDFLRRAPRVAPRIESAHFSVVDDQYLNTDFLPETLLHKLPALLGIGHLHSLRVNAAWCYAPPPRWIASVQHLDIALPSVNFDPQFFRHIFGPASPITTLVIRDFHPKLRSNWEPIDAPTLRSFAVSFSADFYSYDYYGGPSDGLETITDTFIMSNLERLEIIGGFTGAYVEELRVQVPEDWEAPLFPHLRTLRLEDVGFGRASLALIQSFSREITGLELICTTGNHHLLPTAGEQWPVLHKLTVDTRDGVPEPAWLSPFIAARAAVGGNMRITDLTLIPLPAGHTLTVEPAPTMHWLCDGPAPALIDGVSRHGFYVDDVDGHVVDFAHVEYRYRGCSCGCEYQDSDCGDRDWYHGWRWDGDLERLCDDIAEEFKMTGELVRTKRMWREIRKRKRGGFKDAKVGRKLRVGERTSRNHARVYDFGQDFWMG